MYKIIRVVYTTKKLNAEEVEAKRDYTFVCNANLIKVGDMITGHCGERYYDTPMQVIDICSRKTRTVMNVNGERIYLKDLHVDSIIGDEEDVTPKTINPINPELESITAKAGNVATKAENVINNLTKKEMKKGNSMFAGIADKYKSQWIPEKEEGVKMSMDGTMCIAVGDEYVGMKPDGSLTSYPREFLIDVPVYSINKPSNQVQVGDVIKNGKGYGKVIGKNDNGSLKILSYTGYTHDKQEVQDFLLGQAMTRVLVNIFNFDAGGFNPLIFALSDESSEFDVKDLMLLQMMSGGKNLFGGNSGGMNPLMLMALTGDKGEDGKTNDLFSLMLMSQMMGSQSPLQPTAPAAPENK